MTKRWFKEHKVDVLAWPAKSPDLKIIENVWGPLVRAVYPNGKQYHNHNDLIWAIGTAWFAFSETYLQKLYRSIPRRLYKVLESKGKSIDYYFIYKAPLKPLACTNVRGRIKTA